MTEPGPAEALRGDAQTMLITLWFRADDARSTHPVLGDPYAEDLVRRLEHDDTATRAFRAARRGRGNVPVMAARGRRFDEWTRAFLEAHPDGQVCHLGCGLDSRPFRVTRPAGSRWLDVDRPEVVALRRRLYDLPDDVVTVPASVTGADWWDAVEEHRTTLVVAEGLLMYLPPGEVHTLVDRVLHRVPAGELVLDGVAPWVVPASRLIDAVQRSGARFSWALEDLGRRHPGLRTVDDVSVLDVLAADPAVAPLLRCAYGGLTWVPPIRGAMRLQRLRFG